VQLYDVRAFSPITLELLIIVHTASLLLLYFFLKGRRIQDSSRLSNQQHTHRTYLVSDSIVSLYYTQLIGDAVSPPTLLAAATFTAAAVIGSRPIFGK
jgi:hypothetical protein